MTRNTLNFIIDLLAAAAMLGMIATGLFVRYALPPGSGSARVVWGLGRHDWGNWHFYLAVTAVGLLLLHLSLHWGWVWSTTVRLARRARALAAATSPAAAPAAPVARVARPRMRNAVGVAMLLVVVLSMTGLVVAAKSQVRPNAVGGRHDDEHARPVERVAARRGADLGGAGAAIHDAPQIRGRSTLAEAARATGLSLDEVRRRAGFPHTAAADETLGRLCAQHGLAMEEVRARLATREQRTAAP